MCGFVAFLSPYNPPGEHFMRQLLELLAHRGPDDDGIYIDPEVGLGFAHRRLSILDLSSFGHQPMVSPSGRYVIVYNGEIYNHLEIRQSLFQEDPNIRFHGTSDTETLLLAVEHWGLERTLPQLNGMFAFALWDKKDRRLGLARDRLGEKPLYVGYINRSLICTSELKPILRFFPVELDEEAVGLMLTLGYVPAPRSILRHVFKLPPASYLWLTEKNAGKPTTLIDFQESLHYYWSLTVLAKSPKKGEDLQQQINQLDSLLKNAVRLRMLADVPLGACLSGGIDSSSIAALMQIQSSQPVKTFTIGFEEKAYDESCHARKIAHYLGTDHTEIILPASTAIELIPKLPYIYDEPFSDSSQIPTLLLSQALKKHVTVALSGDGGDELFCGYSRYYIALQLWQLYGWVPLPFRKFTADRLFQKSQTHFRFWRLAQRLSAPDFSSFYLSIAAVIPNASLFLKSNTPAIWDVLPKLDFSIIDKNSHMMLLDQMLYLPDDILVKVDRASMSVGLEMRPPLLDHRVVEFAWTLPADVKYCCGQNKWILRQVLKSYLPPKLFDRPKQGFGIPIHDWLRTSLRDWAEDLLSPAMLADYPHLKIRSIRQLWENHRQGKINAGYALWNILMFMAWLKEWRL